MRATLCVIGIVLSLHGSVVYACGHCVEDKVAAVYDYTVVTQARANKHHVAFFALDGNIVPSESLRHSIETAARSVDGADKDTVRVSLELAAVSFAFDPRQSSYEKVQKSLTKKLAGVKLLPLELKVIDESVQLKTAGR